MMKRSFACASLMAVFLASTVAMPAHTDSGAGKGRVIYIPVARKLMKLPNGKTVDRNHLKGIILADDTNVSFPLAAQDCRGTTVISADGADVVLKGYCDAMDRDGDVWWRWYAGTAQGTTWGYIGGMRKHEGITGGGTTKTEQPAPDGRFVIHWEESWETP